MTGVTEYKLNIKLIAPDRTLKRSLAMDVKFVKSNSGYGNDTYLAIKGENTDFEQLIDLRYDQSFNKSRPEQYIATWAYNYWSGDFGSWSIYELTIRAVGVRKKAVK